MALVVFLRGVNVGGHRTFRPTLLAKALDRFDVVNIGTAGTFVVRRPGTRSAFRTALARELPFGAHVAICEARDIIRVDREFGGNSPAQGRVRFVSVLTMASRKRPTLPILLPSAEDWLVRVDATNGRFVVGEYRRHMRTISCLGQLDKLFGVPLTTRRWSTVEAIVRLVG